MQACVGFFLTSGSLQGRNIYEVFSCFGWDISGCNSAVVSGGCQVLGECSATLVASVSFNGRASAEINWFNNEAIVFVSPYPSMFSYLPVCAATALGTARTCRSITPALLIPVLINIKWWRERGSQKGAVSAQPAMRHRTAGGLPPLMEEEEKILLFAAIGARGGEGETNGGTAGWRGRRRETGRCRGWRREDGRKEGGRDERRGGGEDGSKLVAFDNSLKIGICIRNSVAPLSS